jgi:hypothetical protein
MRTKKPAKLPAALSAARKQFDRWRKRHRPRQRLPQDLWCQAAALARQHGLNPTARALGLNYHSLQRHLAKTTPPEEISTQAAPDFIELLPGAMTPGVVECTIEWTESDGVMVRMHLQGASLPELVSLVHVFRSRRS